jgi:hypothetical protein
MGLGKSEGRREGGGDVEGGAEEGRMEEGVLRAGGAGGR